jgi:hypothetical protein
MRYNYIKKVGFGVISPTIFSPNPALGTNPYFWHIPATKFDVLELPATAKFCVFETV